MSSSEVTTAAAPPPRPDHVARPLLWALGVAAITFAVFSRTVGFAFLNWDDGTNVFQNPYLTPQVTAAGLAHLWTTPYFELYMPLTDTIWAAVAALSPGTSEPVLIPGSGTTSLDARWFHGAGVAGHALCAALAFLLLRRLVRGDAAAALGALLWALHPLQAEPVAWVTGNNNVFSGLFALAALNLHAAFAAEAPAAGRRRRWALYTGATLAYLLALLCKPTAVAVPLLALAVAVLCLRRPLRQVLPTLAPWVALALAWALLTRASSEQSALVSLPLWQRPLVALDALAFYLGKVVFPAALGVDYGHSLARVVSSWWAWANAALVLVLTAALVWLWRRRGVTWPVAAFALFVAGLSPMLGLVPFYFMRLSTVADRYAYLALLGPAFAVAAAVAAAGTSARRGAVRGTLLLTAAVVGALAVRTFVHLPVWRDSFALFEHAVRVNPQSSVALNNLGVAYADAGEMEKAAPLFERATRAAPNESPGFYHLGATLADLNRREEAVAALREAVRLQPDFEEARFLLGVNLARIGRSEEAEAALAEVTRRNPARAEAHYIRGVLVGNRKRYAEAERIFAEVTRLTPDYAEGHYNLGLMRERQGRPAEAAASYREALRLAPTGGERALYAAALKRVEAR